MVRGREGRDKMRGGEQGWEVRRKCGGMEGNCEGERERERERERKKKR